MSFGSQFVSRSGETEIYLTCFPELYYTLSEFQMS